MTSNRRPVLLRLDPAVHDALTRWAADDFRSLNAHIELLLRRALADAGRMPGQAAPLPRRGRPRAGDGRDGAGDGQAGDGAGRDGDGQAGGTEPARPGRPGPGG